MADRLTSKTVAQDEVVENKGGVSGQTLRMRWLKPKEVFPASLSG
jgi:hypothetical protein